MPITRDDRWFRDRLDRMQARALSVSVARDAEDWGQAAYLLKTVSADARALLRALEDGVLGD